MKRYRLSKQAGQDLDDSFSYGSRDQRKAWEEA